MLVAAIDRCDGTSSADLTDLYNQYCDDTDFVNTLLGLLVHPVRSIAASWLLKHHLEQHNALTTSQLTRLAKTVNTAMPWQTQLHTLQLLAGLQFNATQKQPLAVFARGCIQSPNKFVRAWAYNLLHELSLQYADLRKDAEDIIAAAKRDEAPSVKARLRNLARAV